MQGSIDCRFQTFQVGKKKKGQGGRICLFSEYESLFFVRIRSEYTQNLVGNNWGAGMVENNVEQQRNT